MNPVEKVTSASQDASQESEGGVLMMDLLLFFFFVQMCILVDVKCVE